MTPRRSRGRRLVIAAVALVGVVVAGCSSAQKNNGQNALEPKSSQAEKIYSLFWPIGVVAAVVGVGIIAATIVLAWKFRYRPGKNDNPKQIHGNTRLEIGWTILPALLLAVIAVPTIATVFDLAQNPGPSALQVTVEGKQWWWQFSYPGKKVVTADELVIPTGRNIHLHLTACDDPANKTCNVIHSFWVPELAGTKDVVPGLDNTLTMSAEKPGTYLGQCKEYCGLSHANMRFRVIAKSPADFQTWLSEQKQGPAVPLYESGGTTPAGSAQTLITQKFQCTNCHALNDSSQATYAPNLTHLASRSVFASASYELNKTNLVNWVMNAPSMIAMQTENPKCRPSPVEGCVGMPSFTENTPPGQPVMTKAEAEQIADYLLQLK
jgi:cytochrome c oxidase subunit 2